MEYKLTVRQALWECGDGCCAELYSVLTLYSKDGTKRHLGKCSHLGSYSEDQEILDWANEQLMNFKMLTVDNCEIEHFD